jgi:hypothetical protein
MAFVGAWRRLSCQRCLYDAQRSRKDSSCFTDKTGKAECAGLRGGIVDYVIRT